MASTKRAAQAATRRKAQRAEVIAHYGGACACCGEAEYQFLAIDHIEGGGGAHRKADRGAVSVVWWLRKNGLPSGFRVLCHNCNLARGFYGYCPHEREVAE